MKGIYTVYRWGSEILSLDQMSGALVQAGTHLYRQKTRGMTRVERKAYSNEQFRLLMAELQKPIGGRL